MVLLLKSKVRNWFERQRPLLHSARSVSPPSSWVVGKAPLLRGEDPSPGRYPFHYRQGRLRFSRGLQRRIVGERQTEPVPPTPFRRVAAGEVLPPPASSRLRREVGALPPPPSLNLPPLPPPLLFGYRQLSPTLIRRGRGGYPIYRALALTRVKRSKYRGRRKGARKRKWRLFSNRPVATGWVGRWLGLRLFISSRERSPLYYPPRRGRFRLGGVAVRKYRFQFKRLLGMVRAVYSSPLLPHRSLLPYLLPLCRALADRSVVASLPKSRKVVLLRLLRAAFVLLRLRPPLFVSPPLPPFRLKRGILRFRPPLSPPSSLVSLFPALEGSVALPGLWGVAGRYQSSSLRPPSVSLYLQRRIQGEGGEEGSEVELRLTGEQTEKQGGEPRRRRKADSSPSLR